MRKVRSQERLGSSRRFVIMDELPELRGTRDQSRPVPSWDGMGRHFRSYSGTGLRQPRDGMGRDGSIFLSRPAKLFQ